MMNFASAFWVTAEKERSHTWLQRLKANLRNLQKLLSICSKCYGYIVRYFYRTQVNVIIFPTIVRHGRFCDPRKRTMWRNWKDFTIIVDDDFVTNEIQYMSSRENEIMVRNRKENPRAGRRKTATTIKLLEK